MNTVNRTFTDHTDHSSSTAEVTFEQAMNDIAFAHSQKDDVTWSEVVEEETEFDYGTVYYTVTINHGDSSTVFNWEVTL